MASIGDLVISLRADIASFRSGMNEAKGHLDDIKKKSSEAADSLSSLKSYFEGFVSIEGVRRVYEFAAGLVEAAAKIEHVTQALGVNAQQFQEQQFAFRQAGVDAGVFGTSMEKLAKQIDLVATGAGSKAVVEVFSRLGLSATNFDGTLRSTSDLLDDLAKNKIFQAEAETKKLADYMLLTGARGGEAALGVNALGASFEDSKAKALALNQVLSKDTLDTLTALKEKLETDATAVKNFFATWLAEAVKAGQGPNLYTLTNGLIGVPPGAGAENIPKQPTADKLPGAPVQPGGAAAGKQLQSFNADYDKLLANYRQDLDYQQQLRTAYTEGAAAVRQLQVDHAGELAVYKLLDEAEAKHVAVSDQMLEAARRVAEADEQAKLVAEEQRKVRDDLAASVKKQDDAMRALIATADSLTPKEQKLADTEGLLIQAFDRGLISAEQFNEKLKALQDSANGPDKGWQEFTKGLSTDLSTLAGKLTDVQALVAESSKKGGQSVFQQWTNDANAFVKQLRDLLEKLLIINPLLNSLGLGDQGNGKQLPTLYGPSSAIGGGGGGGGGISGLLSWISGLFGGVGGASAGADAASVAAGASINSDIIDAISVGAFGGFKDGGDFIVGGFGGPDSQLVQFKATPGEKVSVRTGSQSGDGEGEGRVVNHHYYNYSPTFITPNADSFKKTAPQHGADALRQMKNSGRYV
jgi:hypothetical protein